MTTQLTRKSFDAITKVMEEAQGLVEAIVNTTGIIDLQNENLQPGCWEPICKAMSEGEVSYPTILWGHEHQLPVGKVLHAEELRPGDHRLNGFQSKSATGGLRIVGQYNLETQRGREAFSDVKHGLISQWSVGYAPAEGGAKWDSKGVNQVTKVGWWPEVSNVLVGASPGTEVMAVKSAEALLGTAELPISEKVLAIEQVCLRAVEDGDQAGALTIALEANRSLAAEHDSLVESAVKAAYRAGADAAIKAFVEETRATTPADELSVTPESQHSDPELDTSGDEERLPYWARYNVALIRPDNL